MSADPRSLAAPDGERTKLRKVMHNWLASAIHGVECRDELRPRQTLGQTLGVFHVTLHNGEDYRVSIEPWRSAPASPGADQTGERKDGARCEWCGAVTCDPGCHVVTYNARAALSAPAGAPTREDDREASDARLRASDDGILLDRMEELEVVVRPMIGGGFAWENEEGEADGLRYPSFRAAAWAAVRVVTGEGPAALATPPAPPRTETGEDRLREQASRLVRAAEEVNARYIGGSPLKSARFAAALDELVIASTLLRRLLATPVPTTGAEEANR